MIIDTKLEFDDVYFYAYDLCELIDWAKKMIDNGKTEFRIDLVAGRDNDIEDIILNAE